MFNLYVNRAILLSRTKRIHMREKERFVIISFFSPFFEASSKMTDGSITIIRFIILEEIVLQG